MQNLSNQSLVIQCIKGNKRSWHQFVERFAQLVLWSIKQKLRQLNFYYQEQDIEDIFQDVFVLLWEKGKLRQIKNREKLSGWLAMVAANCAINYFRNKSERLAEPENDLEKIATVSFNSSENIKQNNLHLILTELLKSLPCRERIILQLNYLYKKTHREISQILKIPENTVSSVVKRTKERLKNEFKNKGLEIF